MPAFQKGAVASGAHRRLKEVYGEEAWGRTVATLSEQDQAVIEAADKSASYPMAVEGRLFRAIASEVLDGNRSRVESEFRLHGRAQADSMLEGLFSVFSRFVSPDQAFKRAGSMIASAYSGDISSETTFSEGSSGGSIAIHGLGEVDNLSPWLAGWMQRAVEQFGGKDVSVRERSWDSGQDASDTLTFDISWS